MTKPIAPKGPLQLRRSTQENKAFHTDKAARSIIAAEAASRAAKTAKLREARLAQEAKEGQEPPAPARKQRTP